MKRTEQNLQDALQTRLKRRGLFDRLRTDGAVVPELVLACEEAIEDCQKKEIRK